MLMKIKYDNKITNDNNTVKTSNTDSWNSAISTDFRMPCHFLLEDSNPGIGVTVDQFMINKVPLQSKLYSGKKRIWLFFCLLSLKYIMYGKSTLKK